MGPERPKEKEVNRPTRQGHEARTTRQRVGRKSHEMAPRGATSERGAVRGEERHLAAERATREE